MSRSKGSPISRFLDSVGSTWIRGSVKVNLVHSSLSSLDDAPSSIVPGSPPTLTIQGVLGCHPELHFRRADPDRRRIADDDRHFEGRRYGHTGATVAATPVLIFSVLSGVVADNFEGRRVILVDWAPNAGSLSAASTYGLCRALDALVTARLHRPAGTRNRSARTRLAGNICRHRAKAAAWGAVAAFAVKASSNLALIVVPRRWTPPERTSSLPREPHFPA